MNHFDILAKTIRKLKTEQKTFTVSAEKQSCWAEMMRDIYDLMKYGETLYDKPQITIPYEIEENVFLVVEDISSVPKQNLIFKLKYDDESTGFAISEETTMCIRKMMPQVDESPYWLLKEIMSEVCEEWKSKYKEETEKHLKTQMQNYVRAHMDI